MSIYEKWIYGKKVPQQYEESYPRDLVNVIEHLDEKPKFNWCAFFFGLCYYAYRKDYLGTVVLGLITIVTELVSSFEMSLWSTVISIVISIGCGYTFNARYKKIIEKREESGKDPLKNGGTSILNVCIVFAVYVVIVIALIYRFFEV